MIFWEEERSVTALLIALGMTVLSGGVLLILICLAKAAANRGDRDE